VLLKITSTTEPATDLGFLLHKNPANLHSVDTGIGKAHVFYTEATAQRCTACLLLELDPVELVRGAQQLEDYVNDRPYVSSSYMTVAISRVLGTALAGNCTRRPELVITKLPLQITVEVIRARGGAEILRKLFEPLGYCVHAAPIPLDENFPEWGESDYFRLTLTATVTVHDLLSHIYVLFPVLDDQKHYFVGDDEVEKCGWPSCENRSLSEANRPTVASSSMDGMRSPKSGSATHSISVALRNEVLCSHAAR
jgi:3' terminal RNA ribose 2'-O-methyltransferase Hen1